jgi:hypothetical protein
MGSGLGRMTKLNLATDAPQDAAADGKRPWRTPHIIASELASRARVAHPTSHSPVDAHSGGTVSNGPS